MKEREDHASHLNQDVVGLRATQDSLKKALVVKEKHTQQLVRDNAQLRESLTSLESKVGNTHSYTRTGGKFFLNKEQNWATFSIKSSQVHQGIRLTFYFLHS